ncbi:MAG: rhodanese-related sulfurtransferase [Candidatus Paceibacterota bacterium]
MQSSHNVILYYKYVTVEDPAALRDAQWKLCSELGLTGRVILAEEGINGTLEGESESIEVYCETLKKDARFADIVFKKSEGTGSSFPKLSIKVRNEIVSSGVKGVDPSKESAPYITPDELHKWYEEGREFYVLDMRNDYELAVGCLDKTVPSGMNTFRDVQKLPEKVKDLGDRPVVSVCTGGVRCEKATAHVLKQGGLKNVYQLQGGIDQYVKKYPGKHFKGKLYVFDGRVVMDTSSSDVVGHCELCEEKCERYINCKEAECNRHFICCTSCSSEDRGECCGRCVSSATSHTKE